VTAGRPAPKVAALVLAAGRSTRMGSNKLAATLRGKPLLLHVVDAALASQAAPVLVVTGHEPDKVVASLAGREVNLVANPHFAQGLSTSLKAGLEALPTEVAGVAVLLGDMPEVGAPVIDALIAAFAANPAVDAVVPVYQGQRGNPVLLGRRLFEAATRLEGDAGARRLLDGAGVLALPVADAAVLRDIDTPEALAAVRGTGEP
jgi:molybdenum cofactor cytidylyltransferase